MYISTGKWRLIVPERTKIYMIGGKCPLPELTMQSKYMALSKRRKELEV